jgi:hypothetical protein
VGKEEASQRTMATPGARRYAAVDVQLADFEDELWRTLEFQLLVNTNRTFWEEMDELDQTSIDGIYGAIEHGCHDMAERYKGTPVADILNVFKHVLGMMIHVGMNVPWPMNPDLHTERVLANAMNVMDYYAAFRPEMIRVNHHAQLLQRNWRKVITDPTHPACRRRLDGEFAGLYQALVK